MANRIKLKGTTETSFDIAFGGTSLSTTKLVFETGAGVNGLLSGLGTATMYGAPDGVDALGASMVCYGASAGNGGDFTFTGGSSVLAGGNGGNCELYGGPPGAGGLPGHVLISSQGTGGYIEFASGTGPSFIRFTDTGAIELSNDPGTNGQVLTSQGASAQPIWSNPAGALNVFAYKADTSSTSGAGIANGDIRWNNATQASATTLYIADITQSGYDIGALFDAVIAGNKFYYQQTDDPDKFQTWTVVSMTDNTTYHTFVVTLDESAGGNIANNRPVSVGLVRSTGGGGAVGANPTATIGLTAVNGVATTFLRSDGAPALDQGITPTWTAKHTFSVAPDLTLGGQLSNQTVPSTPLAGHLSFYSFDPPGSTGISQFSTVNALGDTIALGYEQHIIVYNTGAPIPVGTVVYVNGSHSKYPTIGLAQANSTTTLPALGITQYAIGTNAYGEVHVAGQVTMTTTGFTDGDILYVSPTVAGGYTNVRPTAAGQYVQPIGIVTNVAGAGAGAVQMTMPSVYVPSMAVPTSIQTVTYSGTPTIDWSNIAISRITLTGNATITNSGAVDGQKLVLEITQGGAGSYTVAFSSGTRFGTSIPSITLSTTVGLMDRIGFIYNAPASKYDVVSYVKGF